MEIYLSDVLLTLDRVQPSTVMPVIAAVLEPVKPEDIHVEVSGVLKAWSGLSQRTDFKSHVAGWFRRLFIQRADDGLYQTGLWCILHLKYNVLRVPEKPSREKLDAFAAAFAKAGDLPTVPDVDGWCCTGHGRKLLANIFGQTKRFPLIQDTLNGTFMDGEIIGEALSHRQMDNVGGTFRKVKTYMRKSSPW